MTPTNEAARPNSRAWRPSSDQTLTVHDGQQRVGSVVARDGKFLVLDAHDRRVGIFTNEREALRALPAARPS
jgi:hypothetical protein